MACKSLPSYIPLFYPASRLSSGRPSRSASSVLFRVLANLRPRGRLTFSPSLSLLPPLQFVSRQSRRSFLPPFLPAHFAAFCSLYSLTPAVAANSLPRSLPPLKNNTYTGRKHNKLARAPRVQGLKHLDCNLPPLVKVPY